MVVDLPALRFIDHSLNVWPWSLGRFTTVVVGLLAGPLVLVAVFPGRPGSLVIGAVAAVGAVAAGGICLSTGLASQGADRLWRMLIVGALVCGAADALRWAANPARPASRSQFALVDGLAPLAVAAFLLAALIAYPAQSRSQTTSDTHAEPSADRRNWRGRRATTVLDALLLIGAMVALSWTWMLERVFSERAGGLRSGLAVAGLISVLLTVALVGLVPVIRDPRNRSAWALLVTGLVATVGSTAAVAYVTIVRARVPEAWCLVGFVVAPVLIGWAAVIPDPPAGRRTGRFLPVYRWGRSFLPDVLLAATAASVVLRLTRHEQLGRFEAVVGLALIGLALVRQVVTGTDNARLVFRVREGQRQLRYQAFHDPLTGLANRALFEERLDDAVAAHRRDGRRIGLLFMDLDDFKTVNDRLGHGAGDDLLRVVADRLHRCVRPEDTVARFGGDEFAVLLDAGNIDPTAVGERIVQTIRAPIRIRERACAVGVSVGLVVTEAGDDGPPAAPADPDTLLRHADVAMYTAKARGKGSIVAFRPNLETDSREMDLTAGLALALVGDPDGGTIDVHYQPIVELVDGRVRALEALARWRHPTYGEISPATFVPAAEHAGLVGALDDLVLDRACRSLARLRADAPDAPLMHINVSAARTCGDALVPAVAAALARHAVPAEALVVEITETGLIPDLPTAATVLTVLADTGVRIALDDVGAGNTALAALRLLPIHILKLDRVLAADPVDDPRTPALRRALLSIAHDLDLTVIVEGIETRAQRDAALNAGCHLGQGYWLAVPRPMDPSHPDRPSVATSTDREP